MNRHPWILGLGLVAGTAVLGSAQPPAASDLIVHEWGTFLAMQGSDGVTLDGMYHEEHSLPSFVHARSRDQLRIRSVFVKGETPVIYFYTNQQQRVSVKVDFPRGAWTQWYPQAAFVAPHLAQIGDPLQPRNGSITWNAELLPKQSGTPQGYPSTAPDALWNHAREVDSTWVRTIDGTRGGSRPEVDRFLFYRGLGEVGLPLRMTADHDGTLEWDRKTAGEGRHLFVVRVENGKGAYRYIPSLRHGETLKGVIPSMKDARPIDAFTSGLADDLAARLVESGLYPKEARAMVNTWRTSYFHTDGVRVLFVLPREWTEATIPLEISSPRKPKEVVRVMVGRLELLTVERERRAEAAIRDLTDPERRLKAFEYLRDQGRYVEPIVRRTLRSTTDARMKQLCARLLSTGFVTDLRNAIHDARTGEKLADDPVHVRAQLAALYRELGMREEARAEAGPTLAVLASRPVPSMEKSGTRHYLRAYARAEEGAGNDVEAARRYGQFVQFASQVKTRQECRGCHGFGDTPTKMSWFRGWWAGRKYAETLRRSGKLPAELQALEQRLAKSPNDADAALKLVFLYEAKGDAPREARLWSRLEEERAVASSR